MLILKFGMYRLIPQSGPHRGKRIVVRQAVTVIGSAPDCHLILDSGEQLAARHARLEETSSGVMLEALSPDHPVLLNGRPLEAPGPLAHDDLIELGCLPLIYQTIVPPRRRLRHTPGLLQPTTFLAIVALLVLQGFLLVFLHDWQEHLLDPITETVDIAYHAAKLKEAEILATQTNAATNGKDTHAEADPADKARQSGAGDQATSELQNILAEANFPAVETNNALDTLPQISAADPRIQQAQRLLAEAAAAADFTDYTRAIQLLDQIHQLHPGFIPAHEEHARISERRGDFEGARQRWGLLVGLAAPDSAEALNAREQIERLDNLRVLQTQLLHDSFTADLDNLPRDIRIVSSPDLKRQPTDADLAEMRTLDVTLERSTAQRLFPDARIQIFITFYDRAGEAPPQPTRAITTPSPIVLGAFSKLSFPAVFEATYVLPAGMNHVSDHPGAPAPAFYGYTIHVFAGQILQDAFAKPTRLLEQPIHFPEHSSD